MLHMLVVKLVSLENDILKDKSRIFYGNFLVAFLDFQNESRKFCDSPNCKSALLIDHPVRAV